MGDQPHTTDDELLQLVTATVAFLDTEAAFGWNDERTRQAQQRLRNATLAVTERNTADPPQLRVLPGGQAARP